MELHESYRIHRIALEDSEEEKKAVTLEEAYVAGARKEVTNTIQLSINTRELLENDLQLSPGRK